MRTILVETDAAYLDAVSDWQWLRGDREFTWVSERTGWRHLYRVSRDGDDVKAVTDGEWEIIGVQRIDEDAVAGSTSPPHPKRRRSATCTGPA